MKLRHFFALAFCFLLGPVLSLAQGTLSFSDITTSAGTGGPVGSGNTGGHAAIWADVDGDGLPDLYITMLFNDLKSDLFFHNLGGNQFADEGATRNIDDTDGGSHGGVFADLDNDGDFDLLNGTTGLLGASPVPEHNNLYRNNGVGVFTDVTGGTDITASKLPTRGVVAFDMDNDGDLDLLAITNFEGSDDPPGERNELYRNKGGLDFARITSGALHSAPAGQGATDTDFDNDGDIDIIAGNRTGDLNILRNNGSGGFTLVNPASLGINHRGREGAAMGDVNNDGWLDILLSDYNNSGNFEIEHLYVNDGDGTFTFRQTFTRTEGYMGAFGDLDNDGDLDIVFAGDDECYINDGNGNFSAGPAVPSSGISDPRAVAFADIDNDGDLDFAFADKRAKNRLMRNNFDGGNWLKLNLISPQGQAGAFGAKVRIYVAGDLGGNLLAFREARSSNGYLGQNSQVVHLGLGDNSSVDVEVLFLDGSVSVRSAVAANQTITVDGAVSGSEPVIASFSPQFGPAGTEVTLSGNNLAGITSLDLNSTAATFIVDSDTQVRVEVPAGAISGRFRATSPGGVGLSGSDFTVTDGSTLSLPPTDDGQVKVTSPGTNYGKKSTMKLGSGIFNSYLKFNVVGLSVPAANAVVRLQVTSGEFDGGDRGGSIHLVSNNFDGTGTEWNEGQLNGGNAPVIEDSALLGEVGEVVPNEVVDFDVTPAVTGNGVISFAVKGLSGNQVKYYTKEGTTPPQLIITPGSTGPTNVPPVAIDDAATTQQDTAVEIDVAANDTDADGTIDVTSVTVVTAAAQGTTTVNSGTGQVTYLPAAGFSGIDQFGYTVMDDAGATSNEATVTVSINNASGAGTFTFQPTDDGQVKLTDAGKNYGSKTSAKAESGKFVSYFKFDASSVSGTITGVKLRLAVSSNASDGSSHGGEIYLVSNDFSGSNNSWNEGNLNAANAPEVSGSPLTTIGSVTPGQIFEAELPNAFSSPGVVSFAIKNPLTDRVKYYTSEGTTPPLLIITTTDSQNNQPPVAQDDQVSTPQGISTVIAVLANDNDPDGSLDPSSVVITSQPSNGSTQVNSLSGLVTYQPDASFSGTDAFQYTVDDDNGASSNLATVTVAVTGGSANQPPLAQNDVATTAQDSSIVIAVLSNDTDSDGVLQASSVAVVSPAVSGTTVVNSGTGAVTYTPNAGFSGSDGFSYTVADNDGAVSNVANVQIAVTPKSGNGQTLTFNPTDDGQVKLTEPGSNYGVKSTTKIEAGKFRSYFKFVVSGVTGIIQTASLRLQVTPDNSDGGRHGGDIYSTSNEFKNTATPWTQDILTSGNAPAPEGSAIDGVAQVSPDQFVDFDVTAAVAGNGAHSFVLINSTGDRVKYFTREGTFPPQLILTTGDSGPQNQPPFAADDVGNTNEDQPVALPLLANDSDADGTLDPAAIAVVSLPQHGSVTIDFATGQATYTPNSNYFGSDAFSYTVMDDDGALSNTAAVSVIVVSVNDAPNAVNDASQVSAGVAAIINVTENDTDVDGSIDPTTVAVVDLPSTGSVIVNPFSGLITYTPGSGFSNSDTFTYTVDDNLGLTSNPATVSISENNSGGSTTFTFESIEDNQVKLTEPNNNYGAKGSMKVEAGKFESYLKFDVSGLNGAVTSAKLLLHVADGSSDGGTLYRASNSFSGSSTPWDDDLLTANNAPAVISGALADVGPVALGGTVEITLSGVVVADGTYSFVIKDGSSNQAKYATRDAQGQAPTLIVVTNGTPPQSPIVSSFAPTSGPVGQQVIITGQNFQGTSLVEFGGVQASFVVDSDTQISATVPATAATGKISVTNSGASGESSTIFTVESPPVTGDMEVIINADDEFDLYVNGVFVGNNAVWNVAKSYTAPLRSGRNVVAILAKNDGGSAGLIAEVRIDGQVVMVSNSDWSMALSETPGWQDITFDDSGWGAADDFGKYGTAPWNKNIQSFPRISDARWIWDSGVSDRIFLRASFQIGPPQVTSFSPTSGLTGTEVTITGSGFSSGSTGTPGPIQIMPLGNSITRGVTGSSDNAGWRNDLAGLLDNAGIDYDFVGSLQHGTGFDNEHEGHNGYWADEVLAEVSGWLNSNPPDIVLFHIGTNDISSNQSNSSTIAEIGQNLDLIRNFNQDIVTILAGIIPRTDAKDATTTDLVSRIANLVTQRQTAGERVFFVDMNSAFKSNPNWAADYYPAGDSVHPNDTGYGVMAGVWFDGILDALTQTSDITVAFNGATSSQVFIDSDTQIRAIVPVDATSGPISVSSSSGTGVSVSDFAVISSAAAALEFAVQQRSPWTAGTTNMLAWNTLGQVEHVRVEISSDGGSSWKTLAARAPNTGHFPLTAPESATGDLVVRIADAEHGDTHGVSEMKLRTIDSRPPEFPTLDEIRQTLFKRTDDRKLISRTDLDNSGTVDVVDFVNLLDADNRALRSLRSGSSSESTPRGAFIVELSPSQPSAGFVDVAVKLNSDTPVRAFQLKVGFDPDILEFSSSQPTRNDFDMRLEYSVSSGALQIIGYLEKENSAIDVTGNIVSLRAKLVAGSKYAPRLTLNDVLLVSKQRLAFAVDDVNSGQSIGLPTEFSLLQNYPNPFNPSTNIHFNLPRRTRVEIKIFNLRGELVKTLLSGEREPGRHKLIWNGRNDSGTPVASGIYIYRIKAGKWKDAKKMTLVK